LSPDGRLVEIAELRDHPFMVGSQFHPEFLSRPNRAHPLFRGLMEAAAAYADRPTTPGKASQVRSQTNPEGAAKTPVSPER
jgi:CTP synthase